MNTDQIKLALSQTIAGLIQGGSDPEEVLTCLHEITASESDWDSDLPTLNLRMCVEK